MQSLYQPLLAGGGALRALSSHSKTSMSSCTEQKRSSRYVCEHRACVAGLALSTQSHLAYCVAVHMWSEHVLRRIAGLQSALSDSMAAETALSKARSAVHAAAEAGKLHEQSPMGMDRSTEREAARWSLDCTHKVKEAEAVRLTSYKASHACHCDTQLV